RKDQTGNHQKAPLEPPRQSGLNQTVNRAANSNLHKPEKSQFIRRRANTAVIAIFFDALSRGGLFGLIKDAIVEFFAARPVELEIGKDERFLKLCDLLDEFPVLRFQRSDLGEQFIEI
ncbi:MAG TPA: hypothetical protein VGC14_25010, partial [Rhizobium sp.]